MHLPSCGQGLEEVSRTDIGKKIKEGMEEAAKTAKTSAETVSKSGEMFGKTGAFKALSQVSARLPPSRGRCCVLSKLFVVLCVFFYCF